ncbi:MAG: OmcA/MtrC family decaheme c-type cytochrome [Candidatus Hydrogenedentes bacterium]|nr:OmcA/MtrC family decaheme c-type cytochrome [Candidatus Hydrogenedentota bacterium]
MRTCSSVRHLFQSRGFLCIIAVGMLGILLAGCPQPGEVVVITVGSTTITVGQTITVAASSTSATDTSFAYSSSSTAVATVNAAGEVTGVAVGTATISATGNSSGAVGRVVITVEEAGEGEGEGEGEVVPSLAPGLNVTILDVTIPEDLRPEVLFELVDDKGNLVNSNELTTGSFLLAYLNPEPAEGESAQFISYTTRIEDPDRTPDSGDEEVQATTDSASLAGISYNGDGTYSYKFAQVLPANYPADASHQLAGQFRRAFVVDGELYVDNPIFRFIPNGGKQEVETREIVDLETCNTCHTQLALHGGSRREIQFCILCHQPQTTDANTDNTVDFKVMIHKIHRGDNLPSVEDGEPYEIWGFRDTVHDYSTVAFPQDIRRCVVCHQNAPQADAYLTTPSLAACGACHDRTWFGEGDAPEGWENHVGGSQPNSSLCATCHREGGLSPISEVHQVPTLSEEAPGLTMQVTDVTVTPVVKQEEAQNQVQVTFTVENGDGTPVTDLSELTYAGVVIGWPVTEYENSVREQVAGLVPPATPPGTLVNNGDGSYDYTFAATFPADPGVTFSAAVEGRRNFDFDGAEERQGTSTNGQLLFTQDGSEPEPRRQIVDLAKCNVCHFELRLHGGNRVDIEHCVTCHNPNATDAARRPAEALPPASIHFKKMIHMIHTGEELELSDGIIYGFGNSLNDFSEVRFPSPRQNCEICHLPGTYGLPLPDEALPTVVMQEETLISETLPTRSACMACHDTLLANVHAIIMSDVEAEVESCAICHGPDADFAVQTVHALAP